MVALSDLTFLARNIAGGIKNVAGSTITVALATLARGLSNPGTINIDATGAGTSLVTIQNSTSGQVANAQVDGSIVAYGDIGMANNTGFINTLASAVTAARVWTFPDASGTVALVGSASSIPVASKVAIHALPAPSAPIIYYCNNIVGASGGGVTGALVYYNTVTALWLRVSDDNPF